MKIKQKHAKKNQIFIQIDWFPFSFLSAAAAQSAGKHDPMFISRSETFKFVAGETIHLPCEVSNTGKYSYLVRLLSLLVLWKFIDIERTYIYVCTYVCIW